MSRVCVCGGGNNSCREYWQGFFDNRHMPAYWYIYIYIYVNLLGEPRTRMTVGVDFSPATIWWRTSTR